CQLRFYPSLVGQALLAESHSIVSIGSTPDAHGRYAPLNLRAWPSLAPVIRIHQTAPTETLVIGPPSTRRGRQSTRAAFRFSQPARRPGAAGIRSSRGAQPVISARLRVPARAPQPASRATNRHPRLRNSAIVRRP